MRRFSLGILFLSLSLSSWAQESALNAGEFFGDIKARHIGPALMSGRVSDIDLHPTNSNVVLIGTAGGGVWKSQDGGVRFNSIFDNYCQSIGTVAIDPNDPSNGSFELDWNDIFVARLIKAGYQGRTDQDIVDNWFFVQELNH